MISSALIAGIFGLFIGSFLDVVFCRFGQWKSIIADRSECPHCHRTLQWHDLIPLLSFITLSGRCRYCRHPIPIEYPLVEIITGFYTALVWAKETPHDLVSIISALVVLLFGYCLILMALQDIHDMTVADQLFITAIVLGIIGVILHHSTITDVLLGLVGSTAILFALVAISREQWMGWGDVLLSIPVGLFLGFPRSLLWLYASFIIGGAWGAWLILRGKKSRRDPVPFVPILAISFVIMYQWGSEIIQWYASRF